MLIHTKPCRTTPSIIDFRSFVHKACVLYRSMYQELHAKNPYLDNRQPSERRTHIQDYPKTYITRTQSAWYFCMLNARHD